MKEEHIMTLKEFLSCANPGVIIRVELADVRSDDIILNDIAYNIENNPRAEKMIVDYYDLNIDGIVVFVTEKE